MSQGLREFWGLGNPQVRSEPSNDETQQFRQAFAETVAIINENLKQTAPYAPSSEQSKLNGQREALYSAYQQIVISNIPAGDADRVLASANSLRDKTLSYVQQSKTARQMWLQKEPALDQALDKVVEMQENNHHESNKLLEVIEKIKSRAYEGNYGESTSAVDLFLPRLNLIYEQFRRKLGGVSATDDEQKEPEQNVSKNAPADGSETSNPSQTDQSRHLILTKKKQVREARQLWVEARDQAKKNMVQVKAALRKAYRRDAVQLPMVMQKAGLLDVIFNELSDDLRKSLDSYLKAPPTDSGETDRLAAQLTTLLREYKDRVDNDQLLAAIDEDQDLVPELKIKAPLMEALHRLQESLVA